MRIKVRTSTSAILARRLGSLAVPLVIIPVVLHRQGVVDPRIFLVLVLFAGLVSAAAVVIACLALVRLWYTGDQGWVRALAGLALGLMCSAPFVWYGSLALRYPAATDVFTSPRDGLPLLYDPVTAYMPPPTVLAPAEQQRLFPNAVTRAYPVDVVQLFALVDRLVATNGWDVRLRREPGTDGRINARIVTIPGWVEEVVLAVQPASGGARVDMRSASLGAPHDFGANGTRISDFMVALDNAVTVFLRDNPNVSDPVAVTETETEASG